MNFLKKAKKKIVYVVAIAFGAVATIFMISKDEQNYRVLDEYDVIINKASADEPHTDGSDGGDASGGSSGCNGCAGCSTGDEST